MKNKKILVFWQYNKTILYYLNQYFIIQDCLIRFKGYSLASTNKLGIGDDLNAPVATLIPA